MKKSTGGCLCGEIRYEFNAAHLSAYHCHCTDCQRLSGTGHLSLLAIPKESLILSGTLKIFEKESETGSRIEIGFCPNCGSNIMGKSKTSPEIIELAAGSLDDPGDYKPTMDIFTDSAPPWDILAEDTLKLPGMFPHT